MAKAPLVQVSGTRELRRTMKAAGDDLGDLKDLHQRVGAIIVAEAKSRAPVETGALAATIRAGRMATGVKVSAGSRRVPYSQPIHWGWPRRGIASQPFLSDAATSTESTWVTVYEDGINQILSKVHGEE